MVKCRKWGVVKLPKMVGLLINSNEQKEISYLVKRELEELLLDLDDYRIDEIVKSAMRKRYLVLFKIFQRVATEEECFHYLPDRISYRS